MNKTVRQRQIWLFIMADLLDLWVNTDCSILFSDKILHIELIVFSASSATKKFVSIDFLSKTKKMLSKSYSISCLGMDSNISFKVIIACFDNEDLNESTNLMIWNINIVNLHIDWFHEKFQRFISILYCCYLPYPHI